MGVVLGVIQELIKDQVANMYLWPKALEVQIMDPAKYACYFSLFLITTTRFWKWVANLSLIDRAMHKPVGILNVKVLRASKLRKKDLIGASDPYVELKLTHDKLPSKKTTVKHRNLNPEWHEEFSLVVKDPESQALELQVFDWEQVQSF